MQYKSHNLRYSLPINIFLTEYVLRPPENSDGISPVHTDKRTYKILIFLRKGRISYD